MSDIQVDRAEWCKWLAGHRTIKSKILNTSISNKEAYFLSIHAATESMFRRILFVGLRFNKVTYKEADDWLYHNDATPERTKFPCLFDRLYQSNKISWNDVIESDPGLKQLWDLWLDYSKIIRNHISHGIRKYSDEWLLCGIKIDQELLIRMDHVLAAKIGGSVCSDLTKFNPRLPKGSKGMDLKEITDRKPRPPRPKITLIKVKEALNNSINKMRCKADGAQELKHIMEIDEFPSTTQHSRSLV